MAKNKGFTLIECLVALLMLSGLLLLISGLFKHVQQTEKVVSSHNEREWQVFLLQLENELEEVEINRVERNQILGMEEEKSVKIYLVNKKIAKSKNNGHQPLLTDVKKFTCQQEGAEIFFEVTFTDNLVKKDSYIISRRYSADGDAGDFLV